MIKVEINNNIHDFPKGIIIREVIANVHGSKIRAVAALVDENERDLSYILENNCKLEVITEDSDKGLYIMRHSCAHLLAQAVTELFPKAKPTIGPPIEHGFYYDFYMNPINEEELKNIERRMKELSKKNIKIEREEYDNKSLTLSIDDILTEINL